MSVAEGGAAQWAPSHAGSQGILSLELPESWGGDTGCRLDCYSSADIMMNHGGYQSLRLLSTCAQLEGELYNGRLAMLAAVGILTVDFLGRGPWWTAPALVRPF